MSIRELQMPTKKATRQNSGPQISNILTQGIVTPQNVKIEVEEPTPTFHDEISDLMRGFGDCERPLRDSVQLVEKIVQQQVRGILADAIDIAVKRRVEASPSIIDFEFLMRNHPIKINRMRKYLANVRQMKRDSAIGIQSMIEEGIPSRDLEEEAADLETFEKYDEEKMRRAFRADRLSMVFSGRSYKEYAQCRNTSFYSRNTDRMRMKLRKFLNVPADVHLSNFCLTILAYFVHETIAAIVDFAILSRLNTENRSTDPHSRITSAGMTYDMPDCPEVTQGRGGEGVKPITVGEIHEAMRRYTMFNRRTLGFHRSGLESKNCYLAL
ncbi:uncharacterized protein LOC119658677 [Hermetia illucens]|nr:uncharacterized protein LOC119658677 [Hermetia illucens]XP_037922168.1 uncharacterized protein LOC119658677 [Hermetia illucens]